ncbi:Pimeloyl-ACP methyl ester carboxylesterase [Nannocystis exedens]|uniref:Pimeloyl-ACP methyl ester carboxylesterase n=1 Tax=Nannocystis exedens TaxID=54 RepID=A0A1I2E1A8_9BACT|nr:alpha/beta fold hydrolase [Nannocystis exedens]PCC69183.1 Pyrethroid hydrolase [Nannocystis exedens]SFE86020.1 Pimeloyl-ACP methyl ester carboxylesterase [Nannocystis exedens]
MKSYERGERASGESKHFVLVHGAWHGAWCWATTARLLADDGHRVTPLDLPSHGADETAPASVTLAHYAARVVAALDAIDGPVVLVGHSMGGAVVSMVAEARPAKIEKLVYLTAFLLPNGATLLDVALKDADSLATPNLIVRSEEGVVDVNRDAVADIFYADCEREVVDRARSLLKPNPLAPFTTPLALTAAGYGSVRRFYISCAKDRAITPAAQRSMVLAMPCEAVHELYTDHSPFFSQPDRLHDVLVQIARA